MKKKELEQFLEIFKDPDQKKARQYLLQNGKKPKPICPIIFYDKDESNNTI